MKFPVGSGSHRANVSIARQGGVIEFIVNNGTTRMAIRMTPKEWLEIANYASEVAADARRMGELVTRRQNENIEASGGLR